MWWSDWDLNLGSFAPEAKILPNETTQPFMHSFYSVRIKERKGKKNYIFTVLKSVFLSLLVGWNLSINSEGIRLSTL